MNSASKAALATALAVTAALICVPQMITEQASVRRGTKAVERPAESVASSQLDDRRLLEQLDALVRGLEPLLPLNRRNKAASVQGSASQHGGSLQTDGKTRALPPTGIIRSSNLRGIVVRPAGRGLPECRLANLGGQLVREGQEKIRGMAIVEIGFDFLVLKARNNSWTLKLHDHRADLPPRVGEQR